ncbi:MAG: MFS transporter [Thermodesulfobacteriota bacterium]
MPPFARLCAFWFVYMGSLGVFFPYYALYLGTHARLSALETGTVLSMLPLVGLVAQPAWGQLADRSGARGGVLALLAIGAGLAQLLLLRASGFVELLLATALLAVFYTTVMPMALSVSLAVVHGGGRHAFGIARATGTVGYLLLVVVFPWLLRWLDGDASAPGGAPGGLAWMFPTIALLAALAGLIALTLPREGQLGVRASRGAARALLRHGPMLRVMLYAFLAFFFLNGPIQLFPLFVRSLGGGVGDVSRMWVWMVLLEIPLVAWSGTLLARLGSRGMLGLGALAGGVRWAGSAFADDLGVASVLGLLHGVAVGGLSVGGPLYVEQTAPAGLRSTGQALLATVGVGLGGILSNLACGVLLDRAGARVTYLACGAGALALGLLVMRLLPHASRAGGGTRDVA